MNVHFSEHERAQIVALIQEKYSYSEIGKIFGISKSTVSRVYKKYTDLHTFAHVGGNGRLKKISSSVSEVLSSQNKKNSKISLRKMQSIVEKKCRLSLSHTTIKNYSNDMNLFVFSPLKRPFLKAQHITARYQISQDWIMVSEDEQKMIIISDESKFNLFYHDGKCRTPLRSTTQE